MPADFLQQAADAIALWNSALAAHSDGKGWSMRLVPFDGHAPVAPDISIHVARGGLLGMMHGPGHRGGPKDGAPGAMRPGGPFAPVATLLGIDQQTLMTELRTGKSLAQVAEAHGKTRDEVKAVLNAQHSAMLDKMLDQVFPAAGQRPMRPAATPNS